MNKIQCGFENSTQWYFGRLSPVYSLKQEKCLPCHLKKCVCGKHFCISKYNIVML